MNMTASPRGIKVILSANRKYVVPRFQREYSWEENELSTLWEDIFTNMEICKETNNIKPSNYFIGSLVLIGDDTNGVEFEIVDGQQRLTTITILLSALGEFFYNNNKPGIGDAIYKYLEGIDDEGELFFKLVNENVSNFFQTRILAKPNQKDNKKKFNGLEEERMLKAYEYFLNKLNSDEVLDDFKKYVNIQNDSLDKLGIVKLIKDQVLSFTTVFITVDNLSDAYKIFETLNAKGKNLQAIDLIKNSIFSVLSKKHPSDNAKELWLKIQKNLQGEDRDLFYRQFWISKYAFSTNRDLYKSFNNKIEVSEKRYQKFLEELEEESIWYEKIINPIYESYTEQEYRFEYESLKAFKIFNVLQVRVILLSLKRANKEKRIGYKDYKRAIEALEKFHFIYIAVCSCRASGIERLLSTNALSINKCTNKNDMNLVINKLLDDLRNKLPEFEVFEQKFEKIVFTDKKTKYKKLIQYIFKKIENSTRPTDELSINEVSLEHIRSQSTGGKYIGMIGNLLPLSKEINSDMGNIAFLKKIEYLNKSELNIVKEFIKDYGSKEEWNEEDINKRTKIICYKAYNEIWKF